MRRRTFCLFPDTQDIIHNNNGMWADRQPTRFAISLSGPENYVRKHNKAGGVLIKGQSGGGECCLEYQDLGSLFLSASHPFKSDTKLNFS